jgi:hypothetical protein
VEEMTPPVLIYIFFFPRKEQRLWVFENRVLREIYEPQTDVVKKKLEKTA